MAQSNYGGASKPSVGCSRSMFETKLSRRFYAGGSNGMDSAGQNSDCLKTKGSGPSNLHQLPVT